MRRVLLALLATSAAAIAVLAFAEERIADPDLWGLMAMGRHTLAAGWPPLHDPFSYVPTKTPLVYHEWLSGVVFYCVLTWRGGVALKGLAIALGLATVGLAAATARRLGASWWAILVVTIIALPSMRHGYSPIRAQAFTFFFFALVAFLLEEAERGRRLPPLLLIPPVITVWANLHGGFVAGLGLALLFAAIQVARRRTDRRLAVVCLVAILGTLVNPYGVRYWQYLREALLMPRPLVVEWLPVPFDLTSRWAFKALLALAALGVLVAARRHWRGIAVMAIAGAAAVLHRRHVPIFAVTAIAFLPSHVSALLDRAVASVRDRVPARPGLVGGLVAAMLAWLTIATTSQLVRLDPWRLQVPRWFYPVGAVDFVQLNGLHGNLATPFNWGEYVLWKLSPQVKVSFDGRYETVYTPATTADNLDFMASHGDWRRLLREYPTDMVLVDRRSPAVSAMAREPDWVAVYVDPISALFLRRGASGAPWRWPPPADGTIP